MLIGTALIGLGVIAEAQQTEGERSEAALSEVTRATTLFKEMSERIRNTDMSDPRALMETCQKKRARSCYHSSTMLFGP